MMKQQKMADSDDPDTREAIHLTYHLQGIVDDFDCNGDGTCLVTVLIAYAADCRKNAARYQEIAASLLVEARRADAAATAAEYATDHDGTDPGKPPVQP